MWDQFIGIIKVLSLIVLGNIVLAIRYKMTFHSAKEIKKALIWLNSMVLFAFLIFIILKIFGIIK